MGRDPGGEGVRAFSFEGGPLVRRLRPSPFFRVPGTVRLADEMPAGHLDGRAVIHRMAPDDRQGVTDNNLHLHEAHVRSRPTVHEAVNVGLSRFVLQPENAARIASQPAHYAVQFHQRGVAAGHLVELVRRLADALRRGGDTGRHCEEKDA